MRDFWKVWFWSSYSKKLYSSLKGAGISNEDGERKNSKIQSITGKELLQEHHIADASPFIEAVGIPRKQLFWNRYYCYETDVLKDLVCTPRIYLIHVWKIALKMVEKSQMLRGFHILWNVKQGLVVKITTSEYRLIVKYVLKINQMSIWNQDWFIVAWLYLQNMLKLGYLNCPT